jgi:protein phosphatase
VVKPRISEPVTGPLPAHEPAADPFRPFSSRIQVDVSGCSHPGKVRPNNEDHFLISRFGRYLESVATNLPGDLVPQRAEEVGYSMIVADGMGGHAAGEIASRMAISGLLRLILNRPDWILKLDGTQAEEVRRRAIQRLQDIHVELTAHARKNPALDGMGTTVTIAVSLGDDLQITHVGDSRAYLLRGTSLSRLTRDHTYVQQLVERGHLSTDDAARHQLRHILTGVVGGTASEVAVDVDLVKLGDADRLLLCSDGLTDLVTDAEIARVLIEMTTAGEACQRLLDMALDRGGKDNITMIVARYTIPQ